MGRFQHSRAELIADGIVHAVGIVLAIAAGSALLAMSAFHTGPGEYIATAFFVVSVLTVLSISLAYNLWPISPAKWILRRFDHAAIYLLIAATYTPFLAQLKDVWLARWMLALVWSAAALGMATKMLFPAVSTAPPSFSILRSAGAASWSCRRSWKSCLRRRLR